MTQKDIRLEYRKETGRYPYLTNSFDLPNPFFNGEIKPLFNYAKWLEEELLQLRNQLGINTRAKNIIKNMK